MPFNVKLGESYNYAPTNTQVVCVHLDDSPDYIPGKIVRRATFEVFKKTPGLVVAHIELPETLWEKNLRSLTAKAPVTKQS